MAKMMENVASRAATPFKNQPFIDFSRHENRHAQMEALEKVKRELGQTYPLVIGRREDYEQGHIRLSQPIPA